MVRPRRDPPRTARSELPGLVADRERHATGDDHPELFVLVVVAGHHRTRRELEERQRDPLTLDAARAGGLAPDVHDGHGGAARARARLGDLGHHHENEQLGMVITGSVTFTVGDDSRDAGPGGTCCGNPHQVVSGPKGAIVVDVCFAELQSRRAPAFFFSPPPPTSGGRQSCTAGDTAARTRPPRLHPRAASPRSVECDSAHAATRSPRSAVSVIARARTAGHRAAYAPSAIEDDVSWTCAAVRARAVPDSASLLRETATNPHGRAEPDSPAVCYGSQIHGAGWRAGSRADDRIKEGPVHEQRRPKITTAATSGVEPESDPTRDGEAPTCPAGPDCAIVLERPLDDRGPHHAARQQPTVDPTPTDTGPEPPVFFFSPPIPHDAEPSSRRLPSRTEDQQHLPWPGDWGSL